MSHFCILSLLRARDFYQKMEPRKAEVRPPSSPSDFFQAHESETARRRNSLSDIGTPPQRWISKHMRARTLYCSTMLDGKRKWLFSIWRATNKRCCRPISDSSPLKETHHCHHIYEYGDEDLGRRSVAGGGRGGGGGGI